MIDFNDPRLVLPGRTFEAGETFKTFLEPAGPPVGDPNLAVLLGRRDTDGAWSDLVAVRVVASSDPARAGIIAQGCRCVVRSSEGVDLFVSTADPTRSQSIADQVQLTSGTNWAWRSGAAPAGLEEIARSTEGGPPVVGVDMVSTVPFVGEAPTITVSTAVVPMTRMLTALPFASPGRLRRQGDGWRFDATNGERVVLTIANPGTVTEVRANATVDEATLLATVASLRLENLETWSLIPTSRPTYAVASGDTLAGIAERLGVPYARLLAANPSLDPTTFLIVGQRLNLPTG